MKMLAFSCSFSLALVVQRIGHSPAKGEIQVRFLTRAQNIRRKADLSLEGIERERGRENGSFPVEEIFKTERF